MLEVHNLTPEWKHGTQQKNEENDSITYDGVVNRMCKDFKVQILTRDIFGSLIFVQGLTTPEGREIWTKIFRKMEQVNHDLSLHTIAE